MQEVGGQSVASVFGDGHGRRERFRPGRLKLLDFEAKLLVLPPLGVARARQDLLVVPVIFVEGGLELAGVQPLAVAAARRDTP